MPIAELFERFPALAGVGAEGRALLAHAQVAEVAAGAVMFEPGKPCGQFPLLLEGAVKVVRLAPSGREIALYHVRAGEACILSSACLLGAVRYPATGIAETPVRVALLPPAAFQHLLMHEDVFRRFVFGLFAERLIEVMALVEAVAFQKLDQRLARRLLAGAPLLRATHQQLADELGSVREIVSRLLRGFEDHGWVRLERGQIAVLDVEALHRHLEPR